MHMPNALGMTLDGLGFNPSQTNMCLGPICVVDTQIECSWLICTEWKNHLTNLRNRYLYKAVEFVTGRAGVQSQLNTVQYLFSLQKKKSWSKMI